MDKNKISGNQDKPTNHVEQIVRRDCVFQYWAERKMIEDTDLITRKEALELWKKYENHFIGQIEKNWTDNKLEMAIWINMNHESDYRETLKHVHSDDVVLKNGKAYTLEPVF